MADKIPEFYEAPPKLREIINRIIRSLWPLQNITGDNYVKIEKTSGAVNVKLAIDKVLERVPIGGGGGSGSEVRRAKLTASAGLGNTITANLYDSSGVEQTTGSESGVTVYCNINAHTGESGINLSSCIPKLFTGQDILIVSVPVRIPDVNHFGEYLTVERWYCTTVFQLYSSSFLAVDETSGLLYVDLAECE